MLKNGRLCHGDHLTTQETKTVFEKDEVFKKAFGDNFVPKYLLVNKVRSLYLVSRGANADGLIREILDEGSRG